MCTDGYYLRWGELEGEMNVTFLLRWFVDVGAFVDVKSAWLEFLQFLAVEGGQI